MPKQNVSFKNNTKEMKLYLIVQDQDDKSQYVKDAIEFYERYKHLEFTIEGIYRKEQEKNLPTKG